MSLPSERIILWGNLCLDHIFDVEFYPKEDSGQRALSSRKSLGGNGANSTRVLAQLRGPRSRVSWIGPVPVKDEPDTAFALGVLQAAGVDTSLLEEVGGEGLPTAAIFFSQQTGSRTIVSTRRGVRELGAGHFTEAVKRALTANAVQEHGQPRWCHLECRQTPEVVLQMAEAWREVGGLLPLSLEVEKPSINPDAMAPLLRLCDPVFFSQVFMEAHYESLLAKLSREDTGKRQKLGQEGWEDHVALRGMRALMERVRPIQGRWICTWGKLGAFALDTASGQGFFEPAHVQPKVVDSVGAGDTFIAASIHALLQGADVQQTLHCGCAVAGRKVGQLGFDSLSITLPEETK